MAIRYLWPATPSAAATALIDSATTYAVAFVPSADVYLHRLRWWRYATGSAYQLLQLALWDTTTQAVVAQATSVPDNGLAGWQEVSINSPVLLVSGREYRMSGYLAGGNSRSAAYSTTTPTPGSSLAWATTVRRYNVGTLAYPNGTNATAEYQLYDVGVDDDPPEGAAGGGATGDITAQLASWLISTGDNQHQTDGLPWLTKVVADSIKETVDVTAIVTEAIQGIVENIPRTTDPPWVAALKLWQIAGVLTEAEIDLWNEFAQRGPGQLTGPTPGGGSAFFGPGGVQVADAAEQNLLMLAALTAKVDTLVAQVAHGRDPLEGFPTEFTLVDSFTFTDCVAWNVAADVYVLHITEVPHGQAVSEMCGVPMIHRVGWWAVLSDTLPAERHYTDFEFNLLYHAAGRMPGVLVQLGQEGEGVIEAYVRTPAP